MYVISTFKRSRPARVRPTSSIEGICKESDYITVHTPLNDETRGIINAARIKMMKPTVRLINCARGGIIDEAALLEALQNNKIAGAALDVFEQEPLPEDSPFRKLANVVITPHIAASTTEAQESVAIQVAEQIVDFLKFGTIRNAANAPSVERELLDAMRPYLALAEKLGRFLGQFVKERVKRLEVRMSGTVLEYPLSPITIAAAKGFLEPRAEPPVNYVNAMNIASTRGIEVLETRRSELYQYSNLITVESQTESGKKNQVAGTLFTQNRPRIVILDDKHFDAVPEGTLIIIENRDVPGIVGSVGMVLGKHAINIAQMTWGRKAADKMAMTIINVDNVVPHKVIEELGKLPNVMSAQMIRL